MDYSLYILGHAERDIKKLKKRHPDLASLVAAEIRKLPKNPRPEGYRSMRGQRRIDRIRVEDHRIIYSIQEQIHAVIIVAVRPRSESTYKQIPVQDLFAKVRELENLLPTSNEVRPDEM